MTDAEKKLIDAAVKHMDIFAKTGQPIVFGRIEGIKEALVLIGSDEAKEALAEAIHDNYNAMEKRTSSHYEDGP